MIYLWVLFLVGVVVSALLMTEVGQAFFIGLTLTARFVAPIAMQLTLLLAYVPMLTVWLGIFLAIHSVLRLVLDLRIGRIGLFALSAALTVGGLTYVPVWHNTRVDEAMALAVAEDVPLSQVGAPGSVVGLYNSQRHCTQLCAEMVMAAPGVRFVNGSFREAADGESAAVPPDYETWALAPGGIGLCQPPAGLFSTGLRIALAEAELAGYCLTRVATPEQVDLLILRQWLPTGARGQTRSDQRVELFLREGDNLQVAYRRTTGSRKKLASPLRFYSPESGPYGFGIDIAAGPAGFNVGLGSPVSEVSYSQLFKAVLPSDFNILDADSFTALSQADKDTAIQRMRDLGDDLDLARREAALAALQSNNAEEIAKGIAIADRILYDFRNVGILSTSDLPLLVALVSAPGGPGRFTFHALHRAPPEVLLPVADAVRDRLNAIGDGPLDRESRREYQNILRLVERRFRVSRPGTD